MRNSVSLGDDWSVHMNMLQDFSRIVVSRHTENVTVVSVEMQTWDKLRSTVIMLCVVYTGECNNLFHHHSLRHVCDLQRQLHIRSVHAADCRGGTVGSQCAR